MTKESRGYLIGKIMGKAQCAETSLQLIIKYNGLNDSTKVELKYLEKLLKEIHDNADKIEL